MKKYIRGIRVICLLIALLLVIQTGVSLSGSGRLDSYAASSVVWNFEVTYGKATITGYLGFGQTDLVVPSTVTRGTETYSVTSLGQCCFENSPITSITIPTSVTSLGKRCFWGCSSLTSITIPNSVTSISDNCFTWSGLTSFAIPNSVTSIGYEAFWNCTNLTSIIIPNSVTSIGAEAFRDCNRLTSINIPNSVTSIGDYAFSDSTGFTSINIPNSVTSIGLGAFYRCLGLTKITINSPTTVLYSYSYTIPEQTIIYGYDQSTAKDYATKYNREFRLIGTQAEQDLRQVDELEEFNYWPNVYSKDLAVDSAIYAMWAGDGYAEADAQGNIGAPGGVYFDGGLALQNGFPRHLDAELYDQGFDHAYCNTYHDSNQDNVSYTIADRKVNYHNTPKREILIAISGTDGVEWIGNMELTGKSYDEAQTIHSSFDKAKSDVLSALAKYEKDYEIEDDCILLITGHSRGAAVANLVADYITDNKDEYAKYHISDVFGYTFATPNVQKNADLQKTNIFNFCFEDDIVPQIPLKVWGYNKNGQTFPGSAEELYRNNATFREAVDKSVFQSDNSHKSAVFAKEKTTSLVSYMGGQWKNGADYYSKLITGMDLLPLQAPLIPPLYLYNYMHDFLGPAAVPPTSDDDIVSKSRSIILLSSLNYCKIKYAPITAHFVDIIGLHPSYNVNDNHQMYTYYYALLNDGFNTSASQAVAKIPAKTSNLSSMEDIGIFNALEAEQLEQFALQGDNASKLGWTLEDPLTWTGVGWSNELDRHVTSVDVSNMELTGNLSLSEFSELSTLDISGNAISNLSISGCTSLKSLKCAYNQLSQINISNLPSLEVLDCKWNQILNLDVTSFESLKQLYCENNTIGTLDTSDNQLLTDLYCGSNTLTSLNLSYNPLLVSLSCEQNDLDIQSGTTLLAAIKEVEARTGGWTQYEPQNIPETAVFDSEEIATLESFANQGENLTKLQWDLLNPLTWYGVEWTLSGNEYHVSKIDLENVGLNGSLYLQGMTSLEQLSCYGNMLTTIDVSGCSSLNYLSCVESGIETLNINGCQGLLVLECLNNYLDVSESTTLYGDIQTIIAKDGSRANYKTQMIKAAANQFASNEVAILSAFANTDLNPSILQWSPETPGEWAGVEWAYSEGKYHAVSIDISFRDVTGILDVSGFTTLQRMNCISTGISSASLPESMTAIDESMFYDCNNLTTVNLPAMLTDIKTLAFYGCEALTQIIIPDGVVAIGSAAFTSCSSLTSVTMPASVEAIGENCFFGCTGLSTIRFNSEITNIFDDANTLPEAAVIKCYVNSTAQNYATKYSRTFETMGVVTFDSQGGSDVEPIYAHYNSVITEPTVPTRNGYTFEGWYQEPSCSNVWTFGSDKVLSSMTLYAHWIPISYDISYFTNGGINSASNPTVYTAEASIIHLIAPTKIGHTFKGWYRDSGFTSQVVTSIPAGSFGDISLYAKWSPNTYTIAFNANGATGTMASIGMTYDVSESLPSNTFTKTGYTFAGWATSPTGAVAYANQAAVKNLIATKGPTINLYAKWVPNTYTIKFNTNGGTSGTMASLAMTYDSSKALTANTFKKTGYSFLGWATTSTGAAVYKDLTAVKNLTATKGATINLYAKWGVPILTATSYNYTSIKVSWAYAGSATSYKVYRATSATGTYSYVYTASSTARSWVDTGQTTGKYYYYKVYPVAGGTEYKFSTYKYAKAIPTTPTVALSKSSSTSIKVSWNAIAGATKYQIYRATSSTGTYSLVYTASSTASSWTNTGLTAGKTYYYKVRVYHLEGTTNVYGNTSAVKYLKL